MFIFHHCNCASSVMNRIVRDWIGQVTELQHDVIYCNRGNCFSHSYFIYRTYCNKTRLHFYDDLFWISSNSACMTQIMNHSVFFLANLIQGLESVFYLAAVVIATIVCFLDTLQMISIFNKSTYQPINQSIDWNYIVISL